MKADTTLRQQFIRDFMIQTQRPVSELPAFLQAFDSCEVTTTCEDISKTVSPEEVFQMKKKEKQED
mgnify:CR=1 FL=1